MYRWVEVNVLDVRSDHFVVGTGFLRSTVSYSGISRLRRPGGAGLEMPIVDSPMLIGGSIPGMPTQ